MKKISLSSWAIPLELGEFAAGIRKIGYDGISLGGFKPYGAHPDLVNTPEKKAALKKTFQDNQLEVADFAVDLWSVDSLRDTQKWLNLYKVFLEFADEMGFRIIRVDTGTQAVLPEGMSYNEVIKFFKRTFKEMAQQAAEKKLFVVWEFEPGFIINEPDNVVDVVKDVAEPNFKLLFDTCHAHNLANGTRHIAPNKVLKGGIMEFIEMAANEIGLVHLIDSDGTLNSTGTSTHVPFGQGNIDFEKVIPALLQVGNYQGDWWAIDLCEWPNAWAVAEDGYKFVDALNRKYCK
ncbi:xylose isomerase-like TIM barrel [Peptococcaceae bacterium CEB3]|nr:xylose isomerase-like TIM barrel [Peptococcaceae bacterium CEB3]